jgi:methyltransferase
VSAAEILLALVTLQRGAELVVANHNTRKLLARGGVEVAPRHYPLIVAMHAAWLTALWIFGRDEAMNLVILPFYIGLQGFRFWVMRTLGSRWTTRIIVLPRQPLVSAGPYRFLSHLTMPLLPPRSRYFRSFSNLPGWLRSSLCSMLPFSPSVSVLKTARWPNE